MKTLFLSFLLFLGFAFNASAQLNGEFLTGNDGHIYFRALNTAGYSYQVAINATSSDRSNSESFVVGQGFTLGPSTPWKWYWKKGDRITVTYPNGQSVYWVCPSTDSAYGGSVSFRGKKCNGKVGCNCPGFKPITNEEVWKQSYCSHCGHHKNNHN